MNIIVKFFHELINPHCSHCDALRDEEFHIKAENNRCRSCESLERQLAIVNDTNRELLNKITKSPEQPTAVSNEVAVKPLRRGPIPFHMIRQQLEQESRLKAQVLKNAAIPDTEIAKIETSVSELESEVMNATVSRTAETGIKQQ